MGFSSIGSEIAKRAKAFEMKVAVYDIVRGEHPYVDKYFVGEEMLQDFYGSCDYIVLSLPLNQHTHHMIGKEAFESMKDSAIFLNVARGPIVDTAALIEALQEKKIQAAALDVFEEEPLPEKNPLWEIENLYISPHKAGMGDSWTHFIGQLIMRNIDACNEKKPLENLISL
jgi:phosphoglycerate dehydrogenase-like enzyme